MPCYRPLVAWQDEDGQVVFAERGDLRRELELPCGRCIGCKLARSLQWAVRCMHEAQMHEHSVFVTLTYDDKHCPASLSVRELQLFLKRLRKAAGKFRYYACGEYGSVNFRPHYHALIFGLEFGDRYEWSENGGNRLYRSPLLERCWPYGFASLGAVSLQSAQYVAGYCVKKISGDMAKSHYTRLDPRSGELVEVLAEFSLMSRRPGIGAEWLEKYRADVFGEARAAVVMAGGQVVPVPRFYLKRLEKMDVDLKESVDFVRAQRTAEQVLNSSRERRQAREAVAIAGRKFFSKEADL